MIDKHGETIMGPIGHQTTLEDTHPALLPDSSLPDSILQLIRACISSTYFTWGDNLYEQIHGLSVGSSISPSSARSNWQHLKNQPCHHRPSNPCAGTGRWMTPLSSSNLKTTLNSSWPTSTTSMTESNSPWNANHTTCPFLDVLVHNTPDKLETSVYRK